MKLVSMRTATATMLAAMFSCTPALAGDSVIVNGRQYTCTNTCMVTMKPNGAYNIRDCCGGNVSWKEP